VLLIGTIAAFIFQVVSAAKETT